MKLSQGTWYNTNSRWHRYYGPAIRIFSNNKVYGKWYYNGQLINSEDLT